MRLEYLGVIESTDTEKLHDKTIYERLKPTEPTRYVGLLAMRSPLLEIYKIIEFNPFLKFWDIAFKGQFQRGTIWKAKYEGAAGTVFPFTSTNRVFRKQVTFNANIQNLIDESLVRFFTHSTTDLPTSNEVVLCHSLYETMRSSYLNEIDNLQERFGITHFQRGIYKNKEYFHYTFNPKSTSYSPEYCYGRVNLKTGKLWLSASNNRILRDLILGEVMSIEDTFSYLVSLDNLGAFNAE